jgi:outer membrane protein assembly factor BamD
VDHLAGKEMAVGRYYLNREMYLAALNRFQVVIMQYQTTTHVEEALYRLVETYTALGLKKEAMRAAAVLGHNYPASEWYDMAYKIAELDAEKLAELKKQEAENSWFGWEIF